VADDRIVLFATPTCELSAAARAVLVEWGEPFLERNPLTDPEALRDLIEVSARATLPTVVVGGRVLVGFDRECLDEMLRAGPVAPEPPEEYPTEELLREDNE
jgi:glutaredoxin 3